eukprot:scaffold346219_cov27-Prasinocladus_malaysianus.AAC.1
MVFRLAARAAARVATAAKATNGQVYTQTAERLLPAQFASFARGFAAEAAPAAAAANGKVTQ